MQNLPISRIIGAVQDPLLLLLAPCRDVDWEGAGHGNDIGIDLVAWHGTLGRDIERPSESTKEREQLDVCELDAGAGAAAVTERNIAADVGEFGERLLVGRIRRIKPSLWDELVAVGELSWLAGDEVVVGVADGALGDQVTLVDIVLKSAVRDTQRGRLAPSDNLLDGGTKARHIRHIGCNWKTITADRINFLLKLREPFGILADSEEEGVQRTSDGGNGDERAGTDGVSGLVAVEFARFLGLVGRQVEQAPALGCSAGLVAGFDVVQRLGKCLGHLFLTPGLSGLPVVDLPGEMCQERQLVNQRTCG